MSEKKTNHSVSFEALSSLDAPVSFWKGIPFGLQHVMAMFVANLAPIFIVASAAKMTPAQSATIIQSGLLVAGLGTCLQLYGAWLIGSRLPMVTGISFTYVAAAVAICADKGYGAVVGAVMVGGLLELVLGLTAKYWRRFVPPIVSAIVVTSIGFSLLSVGATSFGGGSGAGVSFSGAAGASEPASVSGSAVNSSVYGTTLADIQAKGELVIGLDDTFAPMGFRDESGNLVDGDYLIAICANDMKQRGVLKKNAVVGTIMTNMGFNKFCEENDMHFVSTKVGDRYVLEAMMQEGYNIGGEQSGHIILLDYATTGDGQLSGAMILSIMKRTGEKLSQLAKIMERLPQVLINVKVNREGKLSFYTDREIKAEIERVSEILGDRGRILVRVSGTEPLVRVMLEGENLEEIQNLAEEAAQVVRERLA